VLAGGGTLFPQVFPICDYSHLVHMLHEINIKNYEENMSSLATSWRRVGSCSSPPLLAPGVVLVLLSTIFLQNHIRSKECVIHV
jgi:hypothetical protein